eukprot:g5276.t1
MSSDSCAVGSTIVPSTKGIVRQLLTLASDPENQTFIVQEEGCVAGLVGYLRNRDEDVVTMAAQALQFLTSNRHNKAELLNFKDLIPNLSMLTASKNGKIREFSSACLSNLNATQMCKSPGSRQTSASEASPRNENFPQYTVDDANLPSKDGKKKKKKKKKKKMKTYCLEVEGLDDSFVRAAAERCLISQTGVISVTLDQRRGQAIVCAKPDKTAAELIDALEAIGCSACPFGAQRMPLVEQRNRGNAGEDDGYLDEMDCFPHYDMGCGNGAMTTNGFNSMEAQLSQKEAADKERIVGKLASAVSSVGSWFW